ncbi:MAG: sulfotransferase [Caldilineaceae bacterium]
MIFIIPSSHHLTLPEPHPRSLITIIGRGHSATRAMSQTLSASGVFMGNRLNRSGDLLPPQPMYDACRVLARFVEWKGGLDWDFSKLHEMPIPDEFTELIHTYLQSVLAAPAPKKGWKIPETTLVFPWILRMFPDIKYIFWVRNPRDCILGRHVTDDLHTFGIDYPETEDERHRRAISWIYQYKLVKATPKPAHWIEVRMEDFVLRQEETLTQLEAFLGFPLARIPVHPETVGRYKTDDGVSMFDFLEPAMREYDYA